MSISDVIGVILDLGLVLFLVLLNGFFVAAEFAIVKVRETQLTPYVAKGRRQAKIAQRLVRHLDAYLSATQLGITLASLGLGWVGEPIFAALLHPLLDFLEIESEQVRHSISFAVGFSVITFLHIVVGELAPKSLAIQKPVPTTLWVAYPLQWFFKISYPAIWALNGAAQWMLRRIGIEPVSESELVHSEEELRLLFTASHEHGRGSALERDIVLNAMDLRRRIARDVMRPRNEMVGLDTSATIEECLEVAEKSRFSRFPLCQHGDLDRTLGVVHFKDMFALRNTAKFGSDLQKVARKQIFAPETARLEKLLELFLQRKSHLAIVVDEYGGTVGMVTLENILEELVGQIQDEFDQEKPLFQKIDENHWQLSGAMPLHELSELAGIELYEEGVTTLSGWITHQLGGFPKVRDVVPVGGYDLEVQAIDKRMRVTEVLMSRRKAPRIKAERE